MLSYFVRNITKDKNARFCDNITCVKFVEIRGKMQEFAVNAKIHEFWESLNGSENSQPWSLFTYSWILAQFW